MQCLLPKIGIQTHGCHDEREMLKLALLIRPNIILIGDYQQDDKRSRLCELPNRRSAIAAIEQA